MAVVKYFRKEVNGRVEYHYCWQHDGYWKTLICGWPPSQMEVGDFQLSDVKWEEVDIK